jgi:hypothetical protein
MFQKDRFVADCREAVRDGQKAVREVVLEAVRDPAGIISELGEPTASRTRRADRIGRVPALFRRRCDGDPFRLGALHDPVAP